MERIIINEMPDKELLEDYIEGNNGPVGVIFDLEKGIFVRTMARLEWIEIRRKYADGTLIYSTYD